MIYFIGRKNLIDTYQNVTVEECLKYFKDSKSIAVDTETQGMNPHNKKILSLQLGDAENQFVIDCRAVDILQFKELLENKLLILHNAKFDYKFLKHAGIIIEDVWDTMLAECVLYCGYESYGYGLTNLCKRYCDIELDKDVRGSFHKMVAEPFTDTQIQYAALDVTYLHDIAKQQWRELNKYNLLYAAELEFDVVKALGDIEYNGVALDREKWVNNTKEYVINITQTVKELDKVVLEDPTLKQHYKALGLLNLFDYEERQLDINYSSPPQVLTLLNRLGFKPENTNAKTLLKFKSLHKIFPLLDKYREYAKIISTYGESFLSNINKTTNRIHTDFWQVLNTFRISSNNPNLQNIPKENLFRNCFIPRDGYSWLSLDYKGQELNLMADFSKEESFIRVLNEGRDLHSFCGSMMFKISEEEVANNKEIRTKAKTLNFGKPYGMGPPKLASTLQISIEESEQLFKEYAKAFPKLNKWLEDRAKFGKVNGYVRLPAPHNGIRWFPKLKIAKDLRQSNDPNNWREIKIIEGGVERESANSIIQGCGAVICKEALVECRKLLKDYDGLMLMPIHDELNFEVRDDQVEEFKDKAVQLMVQCGSKYVKNVKMGVDVTITKYWTK